MSTSASTTAWMPALTYFKNRKKWPLLVLILASLVFIAVNRHLHNRLGFDFRAYYEAADRFVHGQPPYTRLSESFLFKYAPVSILFFVPFAWLPYPIAFWIYGALCLLSIIGTPLVVLRILTSAPHPKLDASGRQIQMALFLSWIGSLRLIDAEFLVSQIGSLLFFVMLVGLWMLLRANSFQSRFWGWFVSGFGAVVKVHSLAVFSLFLPELKHRTRIAAIGAFACLLLLPDPRLWLEWFEQMRATTDWIPMSVNSNNLQGLQPVMMRYAGWDRHGMAMHGLTALSFVILWAVLPRFDLRSARLFPQSMLYAFGAMTLLGFLVSPLPWQYTFVPFWGLCFASWLGAQGRERSMLVLISVFLAISPKGILGGRASDFVEHRQGFAFAFAVLLFILVRQARRFGPAPRVGQVPETLVEFSPDSGAK